MAIPILIPLYYLYLQLRDAERRLINLGIVEKSGSELEMQTGKLITI